MIVDLDKELRRKIRKYGIPGASIAVLRGKRIISRVAAGVVNVNTKVAATTDTLFQIGSITKPMTATMVLQLRDEGRLELDTPMLQYLPNFRVENMGRLRKVTIRHLLSHSSGIDGDFFPRTDSGDRAIEQFLDMCSMLPSLFEPGTNFSYCNVGYAALGRIIEILDHRSWDESLKARIFDPLGMEHALSRLEDNVRFRVAVGHMASPEKPKEPFVPKVNFLSFGQKSAGATPAMTAEDLLKFAAAHMHGGVGLKGAKLLSRRTTYEMRRPQFRTGEQKIISRLRFGLAWSLDAWNGHKIFSHGGGTIGQYSQLIVCPDKRLAIAVLTNGGNAGGLFQDVLGGLFKSLARLDVPEPPEPADNVKTRPDELVGTYENIAQRIDISASKAGMFLTVSPKFGDMPNSDNTNLALAFINPRLAILAGNLVEFGGARRQKAKWLRLGSRLMNRVA